MREVRNDSDLRPILDGIIAYIVDQMRGDNPLDLPTDYRRFVTNRLSVAYGAAGIALFLKHARGAVPGPRKIAHSLASRYSVFPQPLWHGGARRLLRGHVQAHRRRALPRGGGSVCGSGNAVRDPCGRGQAHEKALQARDLLAPTATARLEQIQGSLKAALGKQNPDLHVYGLKPNQKPAPPTAEQMVERVAKAKATRLARHTLGPKQKKAIKGQWPPASEPNPPPAST